jgi:hypothetical protein
LKATNEKYFIESIKKEKKKTQYESFEKYGELSWDGKINI